jgi:tRNA(adenine34) deaminase
MIARVPAPAATPPALPPLDHERWMHEAILEAHEAERHGDVPIGAVVVGDDGTVLGRGRNEREHDEDPTAHAEILALRRAAAALGTWRVHDATLYVTLEPCAMCAGATVLARIPRVVYGCTDPKAGACGSVLDVTAEPRLNHRPHVVGGVLEDECAELLRAFFRARRGRRPAGRPVVAPPGER